MKKIFAVLLSCFFATCAFSQSASESEIWARVEALNKAVFQTKDSAAITELLADGVTYGHSTGLVEDKPTMIRNAVSNEEVYTNLTSERLNTVSAGNTVVVRYN